MFRKIEIWVLYLVILFGLLFAVLFGVLVRQELVGSIKLGVISKTALSLSEIPVNAKKLFEPDGLTVEDRFPSIKGFNGTANSQPSYLLLSRYTGEEGIVELIDLKSFEILHTWNPDVDELNSSIPKIGVMENLNRDHNNQRARLSHPLLTNDGGLMYHSVALRKIDNCSKLIYQKFDQQYHHSIEVDLAGNIWVGIRKNYSSLPVKKIGKNPHYDGGFRDDAIAKLSPNGDILYEKSIAEIFIENDMEYLLFAVGDGSFDYDPIHLNDIQPVNFDGQFWKKGDVFLSLRHQSMVLLYRPSTGKVVWKGTGPFFHQHDVNILNHYSISIFNNNSKDFANGDVVDGHNEIVLYNFLTDEYSTYLSNSLIEKDVGTISQGRSDILPNGDLFIEEHNYGRILYFNKDGSLRWSFVNRLNDGEVGFLKWSRIIYSPLDINTVNSFLSSRIECEK